MDDSLGKLLRCWGLNPVSQARALPQVRPTGVVVVEMIYGNVRVFGLFETTRTGTGQKYHGPGTRDWHQAPKEHSHSRKLPLSLQLHLQEVPPWSPALSAGSAPYPSTFWTPSRRAPSLRARRLTASTARLWRAGLLAPVAGFLDELRHILVAHLP